MDRAVAAVRSPGQSAAPAPKGLAPEPLHRVEEILAQEQWLSATELADQAGILRMTARRHLEHLAERELVQRLPHHVTVGRPEMECSRG